MNEDLRRPKKVFFELTHACNLGCSHCLNRSGLKLKEELRTEEVLGIIRRLVDFGVTEVRFTGGEPTVSPILTYAIALADKLGLKASIGTNAVSITNKFASDLYRAGLRMAIVSVDGDELTNDIIRGVGSFRRAWRGIHSLLSAGVRVRVNAVAMKSTLVGLRPLGDRCVRNGVGLFVRRYIPCGRSEGNTGEFLTWNDYRQLREQLKPLIDSGMVDGHHLSANHEICSAGASGLVISPDGNVNSCGFLSMLGEPTYGDVRLEDLCAIWSRVVGSSFLRGGCSHLKQWVVCHPDFPVTSCMAVAFGGSRQWEVPQ